MRRRTALLLSLFATAAFLLVAAPAGAASPLGGVTISNQSPARASEIQVASNGWRPGSAVTIQLTGSDGVLAHATADVKGVARVRVAIPADAAPGGQTLSVIGTTPGGFQQQITSGLAVAGGDKPAAPRRPWTIVFVLAALATVVLLIGGRSERSPRPVAAA